MKEIAKRFRELTGFSYQDIGDKLGLSKQHVHHICTNRSFVYKTSAATIMSLCIDKKVEELERQIEELKAFRQEILKESIRNVEVEENEKTTNYGA